MRLISKKVYTGSVTGNAAAPRAIIRQLVGKGIQQIPAVNRDQGIFVCPVCRQRDPTPPESAAPDFQSGLCLRSVVEQKFGQVEAICRHCRFQIVVSSMARVLPWPTAMATSTESG